VAGTEEQKALPSPAPPAKTSDSALVQSNARCKEWCGSCGSAGKDEDEGGSIEVPAGSADAPISDPPDGQDRPSLGHGQSAASPQPDRAVSQSPRCQIEQSRVRVPRLSLEDCLRQPETTKVNQKEAAHNAIKASESGDSEMQAVRQMCQDIRMAGIYGPAFLDDKVAPLSASFFVFTSKRSASG
jgi:hypothetical protein